MGSGTMILEEGVEEFFLERSFKATRAAIPLLLIKMETGEAMEDSAPA
jgi:hypothetical protein